MGSNPTSQGVYHHLGPPSEFDPIACLVEQSCRCFQGKSWFGDTLSCQSDKETQPLERYLATHEDQKSLLSSLVPTVLLSILLFLVPTLLIQLSERAQHFVTVSKLHHTVLCRYHAFLLFDVIIVFCAGRTALESLFTEPGKLLAADSLLHRIASAFPAGAAFFIGWQILVTGRLGLL